MSKTRTKNSVSTALILRCHTVYDGSYDSETLVPAETGNSRQITEQERANLMTHLTRHSLYGCRYVLIEPFTADEMQQVVDKAVKRARDYKLAEERRLLAAEKRRQATVLARKKKRLEKLEAMAREAK